MEGPDGDARGRENHVAAERLEVEEGAGCCGGLAMAAVPEVGDGLGVDEVWGGQERRLSTEGDGLKYIGVDFAAELEEYVDDISTPFEGRGQIGEKGSSLREGPMDMAGEKQGSFPAEHTEPSNLQTCRAPDGGVWNKTLSAPLSEYIFCSDNGRRCDVLDKATEGSICEHDVLAGNENDSDNVTEVKTSTEYLQMVCKEPRFDNEGLSDSQHCSERLPLVIDGVGVMETANNDLKQDDPMPKMEAEVSRPEDEDLVPSFSGSIDDSLRGKESCADETFCDFGTCHVRNGDLGSNDLYAPFGEGYQSKDSGQGTQCGQHNLVGERGVLSDRVEVKKSLDDLQMCSQKSRCDNKGMPYLVECGIQQLPYGMNVMCLKTDSSYELEKDGLLTNTSEVSRPMHEDSVPSVSGSSIDVPFDGKAGQIGKTSEHRTTIKKVSCGSRWFCNESHGDDNQCPRMEVNTIEEDLQASQMEPCHENVALLDLVKYGPEKLPHRGDGLGLMTDASHELEKDDFLTSSDASPFPERDLTSSSHNQPCEDQPCYSGREASAFFLGHQGSVGIELESSAYLAREIGTCNSNDEKVCSDDVENSNDGAPHNQNVAPVVFFRRRNPARAASSRNSNFEKSDHINKASNNRRKPKKVDSASLLLKSTMIKYPNKATKRRSVINRPKFSSWGSLKRLMDDFDQNCGPSTSHSHSHSHQTCLGKEISNKRSGEKKQLTIRKSRSSRCSKNKFTSFSDIGYAAGELNAQPTSSVMTDTNVPSGQIGNVPKSGHHALFNSFDGAHRTAECVEGTHTLKLSSMQTDAQQLRRGLQNIIQETCPAYIYGGCAASTSERSLNNANDGFSPDSVLDIAAITCESNTNANLDVITRESPSDPGGLTGGGLQVHVLASSDSGKNHASPLMDLEQQAKIMMGNETMRKEDAIPSHVMMYNGIDEGKVQTLEMSNTMRKSIDVGKQGCQKKDGKKGKSTKKKGSSIKISSSEASKLMAFSNDSSSLDPSELLLGTRPPNLASCSEALTSATQDGGVHGYDNTQGPLVTDNDNDEGSAFDSVKSVKRKKNDGNGGTKGKMQNPHVKGRSKKKNIVDDTLLDCGSYRLPAQLADLSESHMDKQSDVSPTAVVAVKNSAAVSTELPANVPRITGGISVPPPQRAAWVCCDDCQKWRCIPAELADIIGQTNSRWTCKDNGDKTFADCSIPQEKTNAEINAELELSDASADEADNDGSNSKASRAPSWTHVRSNLFLHRNRRTQSIDESMVCNCKAPQDGRMGCRDGCLNRMLNIECAKRTCPCGEHCSNQQFQRRNYAKLSWFHSGKKGYGLQLKEDVPEGRFLIEYVGEVLDITAYASRQRDYASKGQKHFYFMALNGGEVIDACTKGNLGRFINHSCSPNCRTEKWMVNGEVCIGIFAMRNIKKVMLEVINGLTSGPYKHYAAPGRNKQRGEELTFDYNYVRVSGAAPQKCFCGTAKCRGYIGGDISGVDMIAQDDAEEAEAEAEAEAGIIKSVAVEKGDHEALGANELSSHGKNLDIVDHDASTKTEDSNDCPSTTPELEPEQQISGTLFDISEPENSLEALSPQDDEDVIRTPVHVSRTVESTLQQFPVYGTQSSEILPRAPCKDGTKAPSTMNGTAPGSDLGNKWVPSLHATKKNNLKHHWNVKPSSTPIDNDHFLGVEGKLNSLLDGNGGISKRKDATNGYLKLLFVTAAEGAGGTSNSVRDLSLILDALLKTKSRAVLLDIINKNGWQMLHNILKQNRSNFHRIPILRKLLKVLEFLASKEILTSEHINGGPRCAGMESFRDSMLSLTRHSDIQVHQIARSFRDRWIPRNILRSEPTEYSRASISAHDAHGISTAGGSVSRKRKSRWDYQPDEHYKMVVLKTQKVCPVQSELDLQTGLMGHKLQGNWGINSYNNDVPLMEISTKGADDEAPPGFEPQQECWPSQADLGISPGLCLERYQHNMNISYGIPITFVQHFGTPEIEGNQCRQKWKVAPGVPFNPFPPLPPYPRGNPCPSTQMSQHEHNSSGYCGRTADRDGRMHRNWKNGARTRFPYNQGRRFPNDNHRFERCRPPRSLEQGDSGSRGRE